MNEFEKSQLEAALMEQLRIQAGAALEAEEHELCNSEVLLIEEDEPTPMETEPTGAAAEEPEAVPERDAESSGFPSASGVA